MIPSAVRWLRYRNGTWHAWMRGASRSACKAITAQHLAEHPALEIGLAPPRQDEEDRRGKVCGICARAHPPKGRGTRAGWDERSATWVGRTKMLATSLRVSVPDDAAEDLADLLWRFGSTADPDAMRLFGEVAPLLIKPTVVGKVGKRVAVPLAFAEAVALIPPGEEGLPRLAECLDVWRRVTGGRLTTEKYNPAHVVPAMLEVPRPIETYVRRQVERERTALAAIFHPAVLEWARTKDAGLRGLFWDGSRDRQEDDVLAGVEIVS